MGNHQNKQKREDSSPDAPPSPTISGSEIGSEMNKAMIKPDRTNDEDLLENGKPVDPRLISLLEFFDDLRQQNDELFSKIFPEMHEEHMEKIKKFKVNSIRANLDKFSTVQKLEEKSKARKMKKSASIGSPRELSRGIGGGEDLNLERFKVKTVEIGLDDKKGTGDGGKKIKIGGSK